ncbi:MAG: endonuclease [Hyphomicrobiales bacterium]|nr:endonuclease [Hyphomicrobiales bacterium]
MPRPLQRFNRNREGEDKRLRGRKAVAQRERRLYAEPLCRHCQAKGLITVSTVPDHIVPLHKGGTDDDSNIQCLCASCHRDKTNEDMGYRAKQTVGDDGWPM